MYSSILTSSFKLLLFTGRNCWTNSRLEPKTKGEDLVSDVVSLRRAKGTNRDILFVLMISRRIAEERKVDGRMGY